MFYNIHNFFFISPSSFQNIYSQTFINYCSILSLILWTFVLSFHSVYFLLPLILWTCPHTFIICVALSIHLPFACQNLLKRLSVRICHRWFYKELLTLCAEISHLCVLYRRWSLLGKETHFQHCLLLKSCGKLPWNFYFPKINKYFNIYYSIRFETYNEKKKKARP